MKDGIHPNYNDVEVSCGCGNQFTTRATAKSLKVDICNACHPFYTGKMKHIDREGRIDRFKSRFSTGYDSLNTKKRRTPKKKMAEE